MASTGDLRDIMDLGHDGPRHSALKKKKKQLETQPRLSGMSREVQALMGDSVPPVAIVETPKYKQKPSIAMKMFKPRHWEERQFTHGARIDGLQLRHWKRSIPGSNVRTTASTNTTAMDVEMQDGGNETATSIEWHFEDEFPSEKWNVEVLVRKYDDDQYEKFFKSEEWTREETDYMMQLCQDYDLRWLLIADRYDPTDIAALKSEDLQSRPAYPSRRMEDLKQRYYGIAAKMLELHTPASNMTQSEFQLWEKMKNFDARTEVQRKAMAEKLFERTKEEADEEKVLLEELYRITKNEEDFIKMRKELYSRLETAPSLRRNERGEEPSTALYQTSQGLSMLLSSLLAKEKRFKTRTVPNGPEAASSSQAPVDGQRVRHANYNRRETMDSNAADDNGPPSKKGSVSQPAVVRTLTPAEEVKFGVSHPQERLTSGVMFRHEKINRLTMAKSQVQTQKIGAALTELGIPPRLLMPTERVCREFERLVSEVQILLDTRRVLEKASSEVKVLEEHKRLRLGGGQESKDGTENRTNGSDAMEIDDNSSLSQQKHNTDADAASKEDRNGVVGGHTVTKRKAVTENGKASPAEEDANADTQDKEIEVDGSQAQDDDEEDNDNEVDQSAVADEDDDNDDAEDADQSYARDIDDEDDEDADGGDQDREEDDEVNIDEDDDEEDEDDDAPGLEDLERANQVTDDEDEENEDEDDADRLQLAENDDEEDEEEEEEDDEEDEEEDDDDDDDEDAGADDQAEVNQSMVNGADNEEDEEDEEEEEEESRPTSSHSHLRAHKRSASLISESSRAESTRSGAGRKKRR